MHHAGKFTRPVHTEAPMPCTHLLVARQGKRTHGIIQFLTRVTFLQPLRMADPSPPKHLVIGERVQHTVEIRVDHRPNHCASW